VLAELVAAFALLTRLPVGWLARRVGEPAAYGRCVWAYPLVGIGLGALAGLARAAALALGLPPGLVAGWTLVVLTLLTGALHEDGLADTADGFGGGATRDRKLAIMRDSRIGGYGALALALSVALRGAALAGLGGGGRGVAALAAAEALARGAMLLPLLLLRPARPEGLGAGLGAVQTERGAAGFGLALLAALLLLSRHEAAAAILAAGAAGLGMTALARRQIGGYSGDVLGATAIVAECAALSALARGG